MRNGNNERVVNSNIFEFEPKCPPFLEGQYWAAIVGSFEDKFSLEEFDYNLTNRQKFYKKIKQNIPVIKYNFFPKALNHLNPTIYSLESFLKKQKVENYMIVLSNSILDLLEQNIEFNNQIIKYIENLKDKRDYYINDILSTLNNPKNNFGSLTLLTFSKNLEILSNKDAIFIDLFLQTLHKAIIENVNKEEINVKYIKSFINYDLFLKVHIMRDMETQAQSHNITSKVFPREALERAEEIYKLFLLNSPINERTSTSPVLAPSCQEELKKFLGINYLTEISSSGIKDYIEVFYNKIYLKSPSILENAYKLLFTAIETTDFNLLFEIIEKTDHIEMSNASLRFSNIFPYILQEENKCILPHLYSPGIIYKPLGVTKVNNDFQDSDLTID